MKYYKPDQKDVKMISKIDFQGSPKCAYNIQEDNFMNFHTTEFSLDQD